MLRLTIPSLDKEDIKEASKVLESGFLVQGKYVKEFEKKMASYLGVGHAIAVCNGTAALHLSLLSIKVGSDDFVLIPAYSWIATANVVSLCGAHPVFIDIQENTFNLDVKLVEKTLHELKSCNEKTGRIKAIMPVHQFGHPSDLAELLSVAHEFDIPIVEDAACALGTRYNGQCVGGFGLLGCFSFHPRKILTTGEGGLIVTNDKNLAQTIRSLRNHGIDSDDPFRNFVMPGFNYRMTEFQAALGISQLKKLESLIEARRIRAKNYERLLINSPIITPHSEENIYPNYQSYVVLLPEGLSSQRDGVLRALKEQNIEAAIGTYHIPLTSYFSNRYGIKPGDLPISESIAARSLALPIHEKLSMHDQERIVHRLLNLCNKAK